MYPTSKPTTNIQWGAIQNAAGQNSLINQLYAGKPQAAVSSIPKAQTPSVVAASSQVKSPAAPQKAPVVPVSSTPTQYNANANLQQINTGTAGTPTGGPAIPNAVNQYQPTSGMVGQVASGLANTAAAGSPAAQTYTGQLGATSLQGSAQGQQIQTQLQNTSNASSPAATQAQQATAAAGLLNPALAANAQDIGNKYEGQEQQIWNNIGPAGLAAMESGGSLSAGRGAGILAAGQSALGALSQQENAALAGNAQGLTAANQQATAESEAATAANSQQQNLQSGLNNAGSLANTWQQNVQSGLNNAGSLANTSQQNIQSGLQQAGTLAQPQLGAIGQVPYSPTSQTQGSILGTTQQGGVAAAGNLLGQLQGAQVAGAAPGQAQASNTQVAGTAGVTANQSVFNQAYGEYTTLQQSVQNVDQFGNLLLSGMKDNQGNTINPSDVRYANMTLAALRQQVSSGQQAQFDSTLAALQSKVSGLLSVGGNEIPTLLSSQATQIVNGTLPFKSLGDVLTRIQSEGNILLGTSANKVNSAYAGIQSGGAPQGGTPSGQNDPLSIR